MAGSATNPGSAVGRRSATAGLCLSALAAAVLSGCSATTHPAAPQPTVPVTTPAQPATPTATTFPTASPTQANPPCSSRYLAAKAGLAQGAAGTTYQVIDFTNLGSTPCTLFGYPGVSLAGGTPVTQIGAPATRASSPSPTVVTLAPHGVANALLQIAHASNYSAAQCDPKTATYLQIYPPDQTTPLYLSYTTTACAKPVHLLTVSVVQSGSGGG